MWVFDRPHWCPHNSPTACINISHSFIDVRAKEAKRETFCSLLLIGKKGPFKRYTVSVIGYGFANMFATQFPRCDNLRGNGIIVRPNWEKFFRDRSPPPPLSQSLNDCPPSLKVWIRHCIVCIIRVWKFERVYVKISTVTLLSTVTGTCSLKLP